jgi:nucleoside-diphosphate-sugar epimerase
MNKLSIFGSTGFIGSRFSELYSNEVIRVPKHQYTPPTKNILYFISTVDNYHIHTNLHIDIETNLTVLMKVLENIKSTYTPEEAPIINFVSSWFVYGQNENIPFKEDSYCNPTGFYSITKRCAEQMLTCFCETFGYKYRIFRLANVIGEGDEKISKKKNALQYMIKEIVEGNDVDLYYGGNVLRDYIHVDDVCRGIKLAIDKGNVNEIYNIGSGVPSKFLDLINTAIEVASSHSKINNIPATKFHNIVQVRNSYLDITKLNKLGFKVEYDVTAGIKKLVQYYKNRK